MFTLPMESVAGHCVEATWNKALNLQQEAEDWYNKKALLFNQFLIAYQNQPLLHKTFDQDDMRSLIRSNSKIHQKKLDQQFEALTLTVAQINNEVSRVREQSDIVKLAYANWASIYDHCNQAGLAINSASSQRYMQINQNILQDTKTLLNKYKFLLDVYEKEVKVLESGSQQRN
ncbi:hypothetical protein [Vibrio zhanjiangensis]|nr:hypothetical protein [Vibrio zhanjiangensis]